MICLVGVVDKHDGKRWLVEFSTPATTRPVAAGEMDWGELSTVEDAEQLAHHILRHSTGSIDVANRLVATYAREIVQQHFVTGKMWMVPVVEVLAWVAKHEVVN